MDEYDLTVRELANRAAKAIVEAGGLADDRALYRHRYDLELPVRVYDPATARDEIRMVRIRVTVHL